ncbi:MAG: transcriptional repressor [Halieaceae bacterium]|nr:transcriptional repressor [Halieaceae bacterium]|tara:strand:- start:139 stop:627 length:489 start_codon:yes stop_codon:yes gene_type:complete
MPNIKQSKLDSLLRAAEVSCSENGARLTQRRRQVLSALMQSSSPLSAYEVLDLCNRSTASAMPAMSVYRILDFLEQQLLVHRLSTSNKYVSCAHITCDHKHFQTTHFLLCEGCSSVEEVDATQEASDALEQMAKTVGFKLTTQQFELSGICTTCQNSASGGV